MNIESNEKPLDSMSDAEIDAELAALLGDTPAANSEAHDDINLDEVEAAAAVETLKGETYANQEGEEADPSVTIAANPAATKISRAPRTTRIAGAKPSQILATFGEEQLAKVAMLTSGTPGDIGELSATVDGLAKKVGDKAINLLRYADNPSKLQSYTLLGLLHLESEKSITSISLVAMLVAKGYTEGTARSQANQLMSLFPALKVADRSGKVLSLREDSEVISRYRGSFAAA